MPGFSQKEQKQQLRLKIKKLKYKLDKQQRIKQQQTKVISRLERFDEQKLSVGRVLKRINFLLDIKGLTVLDWLRACEYVQFYEIDQLLRMLQRMGLKLPRDDKNILTNFFNDQFSEQLTFEQFKGIIQQNGLSVKQQ